MLDTVTKRTRAAPSPRGPFVRGIYLVKERAIYSFTHVSVILWVWLPVP
jgi:hypothetical protein